MLAIDHHNKTRLFAVEELFDNDAVSRVAKRVTCQHILNSGFRLFERHRDDNPFTGGQTVGLDNNRCAFLTQICQGWFYFGEVLIFAGRDFVAREEIFGEGFRAFELRRTLRWAEDFQTSGAKCIHHANHQRRFRADDGQIDFLVLGKAQQRRNIGHTDSDVLQGGFQCGTGIARRYKNGFHQR
ncbi:hypothetical protein D3C80_904620 [compost metagenome]